MGQINKMGRFCARFPCTFRGYLVTTPRSGYQARSIGALALDRPSHHAEQPLQTLYRAVPVKLHWRCSAEQNVSGSINGSRLPRFRKCRI